MDTELQHFEQRPSRNAVSFTGILQISKSNVEVLFVLVANSSRYTYGLCTWATQCTHYTNTHNHY